MQDRWYGDNRDLVKWATLIHLAHENRISTILQVALYRQNEPLQLLKNGKPVIFPPAVQSHFPRDLDDISKLARQARVTIEVFKHTFSRPSDAYFESLRRRIDELHSKQLIVLLDPDTGMAPANSDCQHVRQSELVAVFSRLKAQDWLVIYQHRPRAKKWIDENKKKFAMWIGLPVRRIKSFSAPKLASDVAVFAANQGARNSARPLKG